MQILFFIIGGIFAFFIGIVLCDSLQKRFKKLESKNWKIGDKIILEDYHYSKNRGIWDIRPDEKGE
jgi:hypothetical protein